MRFIKKAGLEDLDQINLFLQEMNLFQLDEFSFCQSYRNIYLFVENDINVAFICFVILKYEMQLEAIYVDPIYREKGIGLELIEKMIEDGRSCDSESIFLEVRASNEVAFNLYRKCGFTEIDRRKKYYGMEDGIVMKKEMR